MERPETTRRAGEARRPSAHTSLRHATGKLVRSVGTRPWLDAWRAYRRRALTRFPRLSTDSPTTAIASTLDEQLTRYLSDAHAIEEQALRQLRVAPGIAGDAELSVTFSRHLAETQEQARLVGERLRARGARPSRPKEAVMKAGGSGFVLFARSQRDTPGKLAAHAYSYEHLEIAAYELLVRVAERAGDEATAATARRIRGQERAMADRLASGFDRAADASLSAVGRDDVRSQLVRYLADAHAIEAQAVHLLRRGTRIGGHAALERLYEDHLRKTEEHQRLVEERLRALGGASSRIKDAAMALGGLNWSTFFQAQRDTPGKLAAFAFAFEHLEIGGYEQLKRVAEIAGDEPSVTMAERILAQERAMAEHIAATFDQAVDASLHAVGIATPAPSREHSAPDPAKEPDTGPTATADELTGRPQQRDQGEP